MRSARSSFLPVFFLFSLLFFASVLFAVEETPQAGQFSNEFQEIRTRLLNIEQKQKEILAEKGKMIESIDQVRIWVRHNGSNKTE